MGAMKRLATQLEESGMKNWRYYRLDGASDFVPEFVDERGYLPRQTPQKKRPTVRQQKQTILRRKPMNVTPLPKGETFNQQLFGFD